MVILIPEIFQGLLFECGCGLQLLRFSWKPGGLGLLSQMSTAADFMQCQATPAGFAIWYTVYIYTHTVYINIYHLNIYINISQIALLQIANCSSLLPTAATATLTTTTSQWEIAWAPMKSVWTRYLYDKKRLHISSVLFDLWKANGKSLHSHRYQDLLSMNGAMNGGKSDSESRGADVVMHTTCEKVSSLQSSTVVSVFGKFPGYVWVTASLFDLSNLYEKFHRVDFGVGSFEPNILLLSGMFDCCRWEWILNRSFGKVKSAPPFCTLVWSWGNLRI